jgi:hypothetical protein
MSVQSNDAKSSLEETNISALLRLLRFAFGSPFSSSSGFLLRGAAFGLTSGATDVEATDAVGLAGCSTSSSFAAVWFGFAKKEKASAPDGKTVRREVRYGAGQGDADTHLRRQLRHPKEKVSQLLQERQLSSASSSLLVLQHPYKVMTGEISIEEGVLERRERDALLSICAHPFRESSPLLFCLTKTLLQLVVVQEKRDDLVRFRGTFARRCSAGRANDGVLDELLVSSELDDTFVDRVLRDEAVYRDLLRLTETMRAIHCLGIVL